MFKYVLIGEKYFSLLNSPLRALGYNVISIPDNPYIDKRVSCHADLSAFYDNDSLFIAKIPDNNLFFEQIHKICRKIIIIEENQGEKYPHDAQLNICLLGKHFIYNPKTAYSGLVDILKKQGREGIECRQGYTRCSVCVVSEKAIITSDSLIASKCRNAGIDVLEILPGYIKLDGFKYGFIGGASINLSKDLLAFTGTLDLHPQQQEILDYISSKGVEIKYLSDSPAFDIGSGITI